MNIAVHRAATAVAASQNKTLSQLTTDALKAYGIEFEQPQHTPIELARKAMAHKRPVLAVPGKLQVKVIETRRPGPIRKALGDGVANALGEPLWLERRRVP